MRECECECVVLGVVVDCNSDVCTVSSMCIQALVLVISPFLVGFIYILLSNQLVQKHKPDASFHELFVSASHRD